MGWGAGVNAKGEEIGYTIPWVCDHDGCTETIDRGLAYCCGGLDGAMGEHGCGRYFCYAHLFYGEWEDQLCSVCAAAEPAPDDEQKAA